MARRIFFTIAALLLAGSAFGNADPQPDINLFGVFFLFFAFIAWFCWDDIQAGYAYLEESGAPHRHHGRRLDPQPDHTRCDSLCGEPGRQTQACVHA